MKRLCLLLLLAMTMATAAQLAKADGSGGSVCPQKVCKP